MNGLAKKTMIYSLVGIMQVGFGVTVIEASPLHFDSQQIMQLDDRHDERVREREEREREHAERDREHAERQREHAERRRHEEERHDREMRRHRHESEREWRERQERENERHDHEMRNIAAILLGIAIVTSGN